MTIQPKDLRDTDLEATSRPVSPASEKALPIVMAMEVFAAAASPVIEEGGSAGEWRVLLEGAPSERDVQGLTNVAHRVLVPDSERTDRLLLSLASERSGAARRLDLLEMKDRPLAACAPAVTDGAVVKKLESLLVLSRLRDSIPDDTARFNLSDKMLMKNSVILADIAPARVNREALQLVNKALGGSVIEGSVDLGGHGGTFRATIQ
jgi:hypothetical protein